LARKGQEIPATAAPNCLACRDEARGSAASRGAFSIADSVRKTSFLEADLYILVDRRNLLQTLQKIVEYAIRTADALRVRQKARDLEEKQNER
jgi:hypothetical protein